MKNPVESIGYFLLCVRFFSDIDVPSLLPTVVCVIATDVLKKERNYTLDILFLRLEVEAKRRVDLQL